ncbi:hypothetical protein [Streptomyces sviceus]|uniref:hypothetical protein n=1 Tax=Streptomyces sviceus TaxID=285530 RepID=UPI0036AB180C
MSMMTRHIANVYKRRVDEVNREAKENGQPEYHIPSFLQPDSLPNIVEWGSDASQALGLVLAPVVGLSALIKRGDAALLFGLIILVFLIGFMLFALIHNWNNPTDYMGYAKNWENYLAEQQGILKILKPLRKMLSIPRILRLSLANFLGMAINLMFGAGILVVGYWHEILSWLP